MSDVTKITVNGREYDSIDQMPSEIREIYLQAMAALGKSGKPEISTILKKDTLSTARETFTYNGREYQSRDELPPEVRKLFDNISHLPLDDKISDVIIRTDRTIVSGRERSAPWSLNEDRSERDPKLAWMLVTFLSAAVFILLFLLFLAGIRHK